MNAITATEVASAPSSEELLETLRMDLEAAAALADRRDEPMWSFLLTLAEERRMIPSWRGGPNVSQLVKEMGVSRDAAKRFQPMIAEWQPRFAAALGAADGVQFPDRTLAQAREGEIVPGAADEQLVADLEAEMETASPRMRLVYEWMIARARIGASIPVRGSAPNMIKVHIEMGVSRSRGLTYRDILIRWLPRFATKLGGEPKRRDTLPGIEQKGADVPLDQLLRRLRAALADARDPNEAKVLAYLVERAEDDRTLPRAGPGPSRQHILREAGVEDLRMKTLARRAADEWVEFFHLDDHQTMLLPDGRVERRPIAHLVIAKHLAAIGDEPLQKHRNPPYSLSYEAIARELNLTVSSVTRGRAQQLLLEHWEKYGPGEPYEGRPAGEVRLRRARRKEILAFVTKLVRAGTPLPGKQGLRLGLDYDALIRMMDSPGPTLSDDLYLQSCIRKLKPTYAKMQDDGGAPTTWAQFVSGYQQKRLAGIKTKSSIGPTRSKIKRAINTYRDWLGRTETSPIGTDLDEPLFGETVAAIIADGACGAQPEHWEGEIKSARTWLIERRQRDMHGTELDTVLSETVRNSGKTLPSLVEGLGLDVNSVRAWMSGETLPSLEAVPALRPLAVRLGLEESRLVDLVAPRPYPSGKSRSSVKVPAGAYEFLPDDWATRSIDEQIGIIDWIDRNLLHQDSVYGHTMRAVGKRQWERRRKEKAEAEGAALEGVEAAAGAVRDASETRALLVDAEDASDMETAIAAQTGEDVPLFDEDQLLAGSKAIADTIDGQLTVQATRLPQRVVNELKSLRRHMTVDFPQHYLRRRGTKWQVNSTAPMKLGMLIRFLRWQVMPEEEGGLGRAPEHLTLADLVHPPLLYAYVDWKARALEHVEAKGGKRGKVFTGTEVDLLRTAKSLVSRDFGFVTQRIDLAARITEDASPLPEGSFISLSGHVYDKEERKEKVETEEDDDGDTFDASEDQDASLAAPAIMPARLEGMDDVAFVEACRRAELAYDAAQSHVDEEADMIRDPAEPIQAILDTPQPMTTLLKHIALASTELQNPSIRRLQHHLHKRDILMVRLLALTALRSKNIRQITVSGPRPKLRFDERRGMWLLQIHWREFKNYKSAVLFGRRRRRQPYRKWLQDTHGLYDLIRYYVDVSRPWLIEEERRRRVREGGTFTAPDELFLTRTAKKLREPGVWVIVKRFTARYVAWNPFRRTGVTLCQPFGPHAFRDVRATDILLNPETPDPYLEAAFALQTSRQMIQSHYGMVKVEKRTAQDDISFLKREERAWASLETT